MPPPRRVRARRTAPSWLPTQATAAAIYLARTGSSKDEIKKYIEKTFEYDLSKTCNEIRPAYRFDVSSQGTVPPAVVAFLESTDFEHAIRLAVSLGGDSDTLACITGSIAEAYYGGVPSDILSTAFTYLDESLSNLIDLFLRLNEPKIERIYNEKTHQIAIC